MDSHKSVSVIIPVFNSETTIARAIKSVLRQTYSNFELIIVNDGSTDSSVSLIESFMKEDSRIKLINKNNSGVSETRNIGVKNSKGYYITFLDSDDEYLEDFLEEMIGYLKKNDLDMVVCGYYSIYENNREIGSNIFKDSKIFNRQEAIKHLIYGKYLSSHPWNKIYKREIFKDIIYPIGKCYEDVYIMPSILDKINNIGFINKRLVKYYQINNSISHVNKYKNEYDAFDAMYRRYLKYELKFSEMYSYLVKEPVCISIRLSLRKNDGTVTDDFYKLSKKNIIEFLKKTSKNINSYKLLPFKYKIILFFSMFRRGK